jgi:isopenicillin N synthase-like dioxygenase
VIPVLDGARMAADPARFAAEAGAACRGPGFFLLAGHGADPALAARVFAMADAFFALPEADKAALSIRANPHNRGWGAEGDEALDPASGRRDRKETFNIGLDLAPDDPRVTAGEPFRGVNPWPDLPGFRDTMLAWFDAMRDLGERLHRAFARDLGLPAGQFDGVFDESMSVLRLLRYPPATGAAGEVAAGAHTDYGAITLLLTDGEPGLQVRPRGGAAWVDVPHLPGALVVNIGDCLMRWTNDIYASTPHRVRPPARTRRSVAFFLEAHPDTAIAALPGTGAPKYPPIRAADHLRGRLDASWHRTETP